MLFGFSRKKDILAPFAGGNVSSDTNMENCKILTFNFNFLPFSYIFQANKLNIRKKAQKFQYSEGITRSRQRIIVPYLPVKKSRGFFICSVYPENREIKNPEGSDKINTQTISRITLGTIIQN